MNSLYPGFIEGISGEDLRKKTRILKIENWKVKITVKRSERRTRLSVLGKI
jgi:hypothetical protein